MNCIANNKHSASRFPKQKMSNCQSNAESKTLKLLVCFTINLQLIDSYYLQVSVL